MKNVKSTEINNLKATHDLDKFADYGRQLHSEAVFMAVLKFFKLFRNNTRKSLQFEGKHGDLKYSH
mgnify:CR=1 FL=1